MFPNTRELFLITIFAISASAQTVASLATEPPVKEAFSIIQRNEPEMLREQQRICEIAAPPFEESVRAAELKRLFEQLGLADVRIDKVGNVIGVRPGAKPRPNLVFAAHLDTVFPPGTDVKVTRTDDLMKGPGIGDDCRGLVVMLGVIRALNEAKIKTAGTITFVADVGEEGLGDEQEGGRSSVRRARLDDGALLGEGGRLRADGAGDPLRPAARARAGRRARGGEKSEGAAARGVVRAPLAERLFADQ